MDKSTVFAFGFIVSLALNVYLSSVSPPFEQYTVNQELIKSCEISLPRSHNCVMIAVPKQTGETK